MTDEERPHLAAGGARLRELRVSAGLSQATVAARAGISPGAVSHFERGSRRTRSSTLHRVARACEVEDVAVTVAELVGLLGPALAEESPAGERIERRRDRRVRSDLGAAIRRVRSAERQRDEVRRMLRARDLLARHGRAEGPDTRRRLAEMLAEANERLASARRDMERLTTGDGES